MLKKKETKMKYLEHSLKILIDNDIYEVFHHILLRWQFFPLCYYEEINYEN